MVRFKLSYRSLWWLIERELPGKHITTHLLRHTYIIRLFEAGLDVKEVQYLAGHSTMDMTLKVYTHSIPTMTGVPGSPRPLKRSERQCG